MKTIHKYPLEITDRQRFFVPRGARLLTAQNQRGTLCLWAEVDTAATSEYREALVVGTGNPLPDDFAQFDYVGTAQHGPLVWHVYLSTYPVPYANT
jgi:hypothetical protein